MTPRRLLTVLAVLPIALLGAPAAAQDDATEDRPDFQRYPDSPAISTGEVTVAGEAVRYRAVADTLALAGDDGDVTARVFHISYQRLVENEDGDEAIDPNRPVTFVFNGGPGSSSVWLHMGLFGPYRVDYADDFGNHGPPPFRAIPNEHSMLGVTDLVFIDPVSTGYSRPEEGTSPREFHGLEEDAGSVAEFIRRWLTSNERWASPKYLAGESYGTTRAAALAPLLQDRHGVYLNGIILISPVLNFQTIRFGVGNDLPHALYLPTFAATARFHGQLSDEYQNMATDAFVEEVERFTVEEYMPVLTLGDAAEPARIDRVVSRLAAYTGLSPEYIRNSNLRLSVSAFNAELLRGERRSVGRLDSRFKGIDRDAASDRYSYDPSMAAIEGIYTGALNHYVRTQLGFESDLPYNILGGVGRWNYEGAGTARYVNVADRLRSAMSSNPYLRVHVACGYYDLATPHYAAEYTFNTMQLDEDLRDNVEFAYYESGHMMYIHYPSLVKQHEDLKAFYESVPVPGWLSDE